MSSPETQVTRALDPGLEMLRHTLATLAYRAAKVLRGAPQNFESSVQAQTPARPARSSRTSVIFWTGRCAAQKVITSGMTPSLCRGSRA